MGEMEVIEWRYGTAYRDLTISEGTGLLFRWNGPFTHNVIEMASPLSASPECKFVNLDSKELGQVYTCEHTDCVTLRNTCSRSPPL